MIKLLAVKFNKFSSRNLFFWSFFLLFSGTLLASNSNSLEDLIVLSSTKKLSESKTWLRLLHYNKTLLGDFESEADGMNFFQDKLHGKNDPQKELVADLRAFFYPDINLGNTHAICLYPARLKWLKGELKFSDEDLPKVNCSYLELFYKRHQVNGVALVFSTYHLKAAASAFGHTLIRLYRNNLVLGGKSEELLDAGINYSALETTSNPIMYALFGMFGGFKGQFVSMPYYYKVREYNDHESRDLFTYELNFTKDELDTLVKHIWELGQTYFDYYYFTENCSYHMLSILEVAKPELDLKKQLPFYVIPADTIKTLFDDPNFVKKIFFRPSQRKKFLKQYANLNELEKKIFNELKKSDDLKVLEDKDLIDKNRINILDTMIDYIDFEYATEILLENREKTEWKAKYLMARSEILVASDDLKIKPLVSEFPQFGHGSRRVGLSLGSNDNNKIIDIEYRFAYHDLLDDKNGEPRFTELEFGNIKGRINNNSTDHLKFELQEIKLVSAAFFPPFNLMFPQMSFKGEIKSEKVANKFCKNCFRHLAEINGGVNLLSSVSHDGESVAEFSLIPLVFVNTFLINKEYSSKHAGAELGPKLIFLTEVAQDFNLQFEYKLGLQVFKQFEDLSEMTGTIRYTFVKNWAINLHMLFNSDFTEQSLGFYHYF